MTAPITFLQNRSILLISLAALAVAGCSSDDDTSSDQVMLSGDPAYSLQLLHAADMDGTSGALDNVSAFSALVSSFEAEFPDSTLILSSGDNYIPGPRYFAASADELAPLLGVPGNGRADIAYHNAMGFAASAVGNHELDQGTGAFAGLIASDVDTGSGAQYPGADFPYLSSNLEFTTDESTAALTAAGGQDAENIAGRLAPSAVVTVGGQRIGLVGATTPTLAAITSAGTVTVSPTDSTDTTALADIIQTAVDALLADGINKVILLAHMQQIDIEKSLATLLTGVDIIIAGGSNTLLADSNDTLRPGDVAADTYPLQLNSANDEPVLLVNTAGDYKYLGRLLVDFDSAGRVLNGNLDEEVNGAWASTEANLTALNATPLPEVESITAALQSVLAARDGNIVGRTAVYLDGRRSQVRTQETNMGNLTADANLWLAKMADPSVSVALKNGGGIRSDIGLVIQPPGTTDPSDVTYLPPQANTASGKAEGDISQFDIETVLRFNNGLTLLTVTVEELKDIMEHAVGATEDGATPGRFPQLSGLQIEFDPTRTARDGSDTNGSATVPGERITSMSVIDADGAVTDSLYANGGFIGDASRTVRLVILDFIAKCVGVVGESCGDGYPLNGLDSPDRVDLTAEGTDPGQSAFADAGSEQDALAEYLRAQFTDLPYAESETPVAQDTRILNTTAE